MIDYVKFVLLPWLVIIAGFTAIYVLLGGLALGVALILLAVIFSIVAITLETLIIAGLAAVAGIVLITMNLT